MEPDTFAQIILAAYLIVAAVTVGRQAVRSEGGWRLWLLYGLERLYVPLVFRWRADRRCPFPGDGPFIVIANHRSPVDPLFLWMNHHLGERGTQPIRPLSFMVAREYARKPGVNWICRVNRCIPVDRGRSDIRAVRGTLRRLQEGGWVGVFPEGRINVETDGLLPGNPGVAWLVLKSRVPVYPVFIHGSPGGESMVEPFYTFSRVRVAYGEPVDLGEYYGRRASDDLLAEITDLLMRRVAELGGVSYAGVRTEDLENDQSVS